MLNSKILIVEDEAISALDLQSRLQNRRFDADIAFSGEEAIRKSADAGPDLVLMDIMLPGDIDGITAAEQIKSRFDIPVIYVTAYADEATLQRAKITEPFGYIIKPFQERELAIAIEMALYKHRMDKKIKENEKWLATILRSIGDAVIVIDKSSSVTFINGVAEKLTGWRMEEAVNKSLNHIFRIVNRYTREPHEDIAEKVLLDGVVRGLANHTILISRDGTEIPIDDSMAPIKDGLGKIMGAVIVFRDVTEREKADEKLRQAYREWENTFDSISDPISIHDREFKVVRANRAFAETLGLEQQDFLGKKCHELIHGSKEPWKICPHRQCIMSKKTVTEEFLEPRLGRYLIVSCSPVFDYQNQFIGTVHVIKDITERNRAMEQLKLRTAELQTANSDLESFTYSVSHDLRSPLRAIDGFTNMLLRDIGDALDPESKRKFNVIRNNAEKMNNLIDDLLNLSRTGRAALSQSRIDMHSLVMDVWKELRAGNPGRNMELKIDNLPPSSGDSILLRQVFSNLLGNAVKFTGKKDYAIIEVSGSVSGGFNAYCIKDNGAGFDMHYSDQLFGVFRRLHSESEFKGTGVGLAIVKKIIQKHGGTIRAEGKPGEGAAFFFTLPVKVSSGNQKQLTGEQ